MDDMTLSNEIRRAIEDSGWSRYRLAQETGIAQSVLSRFMAGKSLTLDTVDRIAKVLGLKLAPTRKPKATKER